MTYNGLSRLAHTLGIDVAMQVARDFVRAEREHVARVREAIDACEDEMTEDEHLWREGWIE